MIDIEPQNGLLKQEPLLDGTSCWHNGRLGHVKHDLCLVSTLTSASHYSPRQLDDLLNISLKKRSDDLLDGNHLLTAGLELTGLEETGHRGSLLALRQLERGPYDDDDFAPNPDTGINAERDLPLGEGDGLGGLTGLVRNLGSVLGGASPVGTGLPGGLVSISGLNGKVSLMIAGPQVRVDCHMGHRPRTLHCLPLVRCRPMSSFVLLEVAPPCILLPPLMRVLAIARRAWA